MANRDFIITGLQSWDIPIGSNAIDIARELATDNRVLYVNSPLDLMTMVRNRQHKVKDHRNAVLRGRSKPLRKVGKRLWVLDFPFFIWSVNGLPDGRLFDAVNKWNNRRIFRYVQRIADQLGFVHPIQIIDNDIYRSYYSKELLDARMTVYYRRDNLQPFPYWNRHVGRLEPALIAKSDLVVCNSLQLATFAKNFNPESYDIGQGVDLSAYDPSLSHPEPAEIAGIPSPRFGYIGDINSLRLDPDLIFDMARSRPGYSFILTGGEDDIFSRHPLHRLPNVHFTGSVARYRVPSFIAAMDVCMNPQQVNEITIGNYPRKVDEYLAMGKTVLATRTPAMELFREHVFLCTTASDFIRSADESLRSDTSEKKAARIRFAQSHSWRNNVTTLTHLIEKHLK
jgi:glycosyltransferase involved in cell wall biosynthesis